MFGKKEAISDPDLEFFTIYDSKTDSYRAPMPAANSLDMIRELERMFRDPSQAQNQYLTNAEDFSLFKIGGFYRKKGLMIAQEPQHVINLHDLRTSSLRKQDPGALSPT